MEWVKIIGEQNSSENIKLLAVQRKIYSYAKTWRNFNVFISLALVLAALMQRYYYPEFKYLYFFGAVWIVLSYSIKNKVANLIKTAAKIQEEFDTNLFKLPWNNILVGKKVDVENIEEIALKVDNYNEDESLKHWYGNEIYIVTKPYPFIALVCQKNNLWWDCRLKRTCSIIACIYVISMTFILYHVGSEMITSEFLLNLVVPAFPAIFIGADAAYRFNMIAKMQSEKSKIAEEIIKANEVTVQVCRQMQDFIFLMRSNEAMVPDFVYKKLKNKLDKVMDRVVRTLNS